MLNSSFLHIPSIGQKTEKKIWGDGIETADEFIKSPSKSIPPKTREKILNHINTSDKLETLIITMIIYHQVNNGEFSKGFKRAQLILILRQLVLIPIGMKLQPLLCMMVKISSIM